MIWICLWCLHGWRAALAHRLDQRIEFFAVVQYIEAMSICRVVFFRFHRLSVLMVSLHMESILAGLSSLVSLDSAHIGWGRQLTLWIRLRKPSHIRIIESERVVVRSRFPVKALPLVT